MEKIIVIGHKNQDTDATAAAMVMAELLNKTKQWEATANIFDKPNQETAYILKRFNIKEPAKLKIGKNKNFFLVDFNEEDQSPIPFNKIEIQGLVDHHKLNIKIAKDSPIIFRVEPIGSACSIIAKMYQDYKIKINKKIATLLLCGIISDTLKFASPTTTKEDEQIAKTLAKIAKIDIEELANKMFEAKSNLDKLTPQEIISSDYKEYHFGKSKIGIGVLETINPASAFKKEREIRKASSELKKNKKLDFIFFGVVDILKKSTSFFLIGSEEEELAIKAFRKKKVTNGIIELPGTTSRKKQIVPAFMKILK
jgi:manganese-dependent inorganic pyrophosphatase